MSTLETRTIALLKEIRSRVAAGRIRPDLALRLSINEAPVEWPEIGCRRVGFFATSGDPFYWGHIYVSLCAILELDLNFVVMQVMGDHPHKRGTKQSKEHRHTIARRALEYFFPLLRYTPLGFDNMKIGEENASELLLLNYGLPLEVFYIAGGDVHGIAAANLAACRTLLKPRDGSETPICAGYFSLDRTTRHPPGDCCMSIRFSKWPSGIMGPFQGCVARNCPLPCFGRARIFRSCLPLVWTTSPNTDCTAGMPRPRCTLVSANRRVMHSLVSADKTNTEPELSTRKRDDTKPECASGDDRTESVTAHQFSIRTSNVTIVACRASCPAGRSHQDRCRLNDPVSSVPHGAGEV